MNPTMPPTLHRRQLLALALSAAPGALLAQPLHSATGTLHAHSTGARGWRRMGIGALWW